MLFLTTAQKYFFRNARLRHLRIEQVVRYFSSGANNARSEETNEDTIEGDDDAVGVDGSHRHFDNFCENTAIGSKFPCVAKGLETLTRRAQSRLAVSRLPYLEPLGARREEYPGRPTRFILFSAFACVESGLHP